MKPARMQICPGPAGTKESAPGSPRDSGPTGIPPYSDAKKQTLRNHFDLCARWRVEWEERASAYYGDQIRFFKYLVPEGLRVLEIGSGVGSLLAALRPSRGVGIELSPQMAKRAAQRHPMLEFRVDDVETLDIAETFDVILLADVVGHLFDIEAALHRLRHACAPETRVIISHHNSAWAPFLRWAERLGMKMPQPKQSWPSTADLINLLHLADFDEVKTEHRLLVPVHIPFVTSFVNRFLACLPGLRALCLCHYVVARPRLREPERPYSTTIVIPCRNNREHIGAVIERIPPFGGRQEILFVDDHSTDGTQHEIERAMAYYPEKNIKLLVQRGNGKGDAVRTGFSQATGDVLMTLDADLTVAPEDLPKFYHAIANGKGELINGCRLVYPIKSHTRGILNRIGSRVFSLVFSWLLNQPIKDMLCGTKVMFRQDYERLVAKQGAFRDTDPSGSFDLLFGASQLNLHIVELPIRDQAQTRAVARGQGVVRWWLFFKMAVSGFFRLKVV